MKGWLLCVRTADPTCLGRRERSGRYRGLRNTGQHQLPIRSRQEKEGRTKGESGDSKEDETPACRDHCCRLQMNVETLHAVLAINGPPSHILAPRLVQSRQLDQKSPAPECVPDCEAKGWRWRRSVLGLHNCLCISLLSQWLSLLSTLCSKRTRLPADNEGPAQAWQG